MSIQSEIIDALEELEDDLDMTLTLPSGATIPCVPGGEEVWTDVQPSGPQTEGLSEFVKVRKSHFVTADSEVVTADSDVILADNSTGRPRSGQSNYRTSGFRGKTYKVIRVKEDATGAYFAIHLWSAKK